MPPRPHRGPHARADNIDLATDDILDLLIYVIVQAHPHSASLIVELDYIQRFHFFAMSSVSLIGCVRALLLACQVGICWPVCVLCPHFWRARRWVWNAWRGGGGRYCLRIQP